MTVDARGRSAASTLLHAARTDVEARVMLDHLHATRTPRVSSRTVAGSVLVVRSVLRERGNGTFAALTVPVSLTGATSSRMLDNR